MGGQCSSGSGIAARLAFFRDGGRQQQQPQQAAMNAAQVQALQLSRATGAFAGASRIRTNGAAITNGPFTTRLAGDGNAEDAMMAPMTVNDFTGQDEIVIRVLRDNGGDEVLDAAGKPIVDEVRLLAKNDNFLGKCFFQDQCNRDRGDRNKTYYQSANSEWSLYYCTPNRRWQVIKEVYVTGSGGKQVRCRPNHIRVACFSDQGVDHPGRSSSWTCPTMRASHEPRVNTPLSVAGIAVH